MHFTGIYNFKIGICSGQILSICAKVAVLDESTSFYMVNFLQG
jgi:hypothetical protein